MTIDLYYVETSQRIIVRQVHPRLPIVITKVVEDSFPCLEDWLPSSPPVHRGKAFLKLIQQNF